MGCLLHADRHSRGGGCLLRAQSHFGAWRTRTWWGSLHDRQGKTICPTNGNSCRASPSASCVPRRSSQRPLCPYPDEPASPSSPATVNNELAGLVVPYGNLATPRRVPSSETYAARTVRASVRQSGLRSLGGAVTMKWTHYPSMLFLALRQPFPLASTD